MSATIDSGRFGKLLIDTGETILIPHGILGFPDCTRFCLVDPNDDTLIMWLQSMDDSALAFPLLEPKIFKPDYAVRLSAAELRELKLEKINQAAVFSIITIPEDITQMSANLKAPLVINLKNQTAKQVVLQENEYTIKHMMFRELKAHLVTLQSQRRRVQPSVQPVTVKNLEPSVFVKSLETVIL